jgi:hypothetical protein
MPRVLVLTDFLAEWTGSEIVALEVAEHFGATTSSYWVADPLKSILADWRPIEEIDLTDYDLVWAQQHAVLSVLGKHQADHRPFIVWASLSPYEVMEKLPPSLLEVYADAVAANSLETAEVVGADLVFGNAAPAPFHFDRAHRPLKNILFVSNNQPAEMIEAAQVLTRRGFTTRFLGRNYEFKRLAPSDIQWADCVVTIGKTARYSLASSTPTFIYDRFGGDGYVTAENYALNEANNFSGRPNCRRLDARSIADELVAGHAPWEPPPQVALGDILDQLATRAAKAEFIRHPDLVAAATMSDALGNSLCQARGWQLEHRKLHDGEIGSWRWWASYTKAKLVRTAREVLAFGKAPAA